MAHNDALMTTHPLPLLQQRTPYGLFEVYTSDEAVSQIDYLQVSQIHSAEVIPYRPSQSSGEIAVLRADGLIYFHADISTSPRPNLLIKTADCVPIFLGSKHGCAMLHAGWRGLHQKILHHPLIKQLQPDYAFIGPHICERCYQVGPEFQDHFPNSPGLKKKNDQWFFGLQAEAIFQIQQLSAKIQIEHSDLCTFCDKRLHSYRRGNNKQRNYNIFRYTF